MGEMSSPDHTGMRTPAPPEVTRAFDESLRTTGDQLSLQPAPENGQPLAFSELTAPGAVVILSILSEQLLAQPLSEPTAPGAVVILSEQLLAQELSQLAFSELTAPGAASPQPPQQAAPSWL